MSYRTALHAVVLLVILGCASLLPGQGDPGAFELRLQREELVLFPFDTYSFPFRSGVQIGLTEASRSARNPVLRRGAPGQPDSQFVAYYGTVLRAGDQYRMWYICGGDRDTGATISWFRTSKTRVCYATSPDGEHWTKPELGLVEYGGSTRNNLVSLDGQNDSIISAAVLYEPEDPAPGRRFKMAYETLPHMGFCAAYSADGLVWKNSPNNPVLKSSLEHTGLIKHRGAYYVTGQSQIFNKRVLGVHVSYDFEHWTEASAIGFRRDNLGPLHPPIYGAATGEQVHVGASLWDRGNVILGFYGQWHGPGPESNDRRFLTLDLGLVVSPDAIHYTEPIRDFKIVPMANESWAQPLLGLAQGQGTHNIGEKTVTWYSLWGPGGGEGVRMASWGRDRLGYFQVPRVITEGQRQAPGLAPHFISCPIRLDHPAHVFLNVAGLGEYSHVTVEILDEQFRKLPGYSGADAIKINQPGMLVPVAWGAKDTVQAFPHAIRIQVNFGGVRIEDTRVYAVYVK
jgi:hypothetical protein